MEEQHRQFLKAIYAVQDEVGRADALAIGQHLGLDILINTNDRYQYHETTLQLRDSGYLECIAVKYNLTCGTVRLTPPGLDMAESAREKKSATQKDIMPNN
jgi:hypothetical protein